MFWNARGARIISEPDAVIQMPSRRYPALAVQGDTLGAWAIRIDLILSLARQTANAELIAHAESLRKQIVRCLETYDRICREEAERDLINLGLHN